MDQLENKHKRRKRYKGTHPKSYQEKYKELEPDKYQETIQKVMNKGMTPAGMHRPICVNEILDFFDIKPGQFGLDATLGYGGHTLEMLKALNKEGHLFAIDQDPIELPKTKERLSQFGFNEEILTIKHLNFKDLESHISADLKFDFVLADLGVSSMQIDNPERGFTFKSKGLLDLRMNPNKGIPARDRLKELNQDEMIGMLIENADEPYAKEIATKIINHLNYGKDITYTLDLYQLIADALKFLPIKERDEEIKKSSQRVFQALRIDVNQEFEALFQFLETVPKILKEKGKVAILTFHSGEDRLVKKSFQHYFRNGTYQSISDGPIRPSLEEQGTNPRARSAKLRWAIKA